MKENERYIINEEELALLERVEGLADVKKTSKDYMKCSKEGLAVICCLKNKTNDMFIRRYEAAKAVIDIIARQIGINPENCGFWLYAPNIDGTSPISERIESWFSRSGEKSQLKRRIQELENENAVLRSLVKGVGAK